MVGRQPIPRKPGGRLSSLGRGEYCLRHDESSYDALAHIIKVYQGAKVAEAGSNDENMCDDANAWLSRRR